MVTKQLQHYVKSLSSRTQEIYMKKALLQQTVSVLVSVSSDFIWQIMT